MTTAKKAPRRLERVFAFKVLYGLCFSPAADLQALERAFLQSPDGPADRVGTDENKPSSFAWELVSGVWQHQQKLDERIRELSRNWRPERMGKVELTLLRLALFELLYAKDVPPKAIINEAVELSKQFGEADAGSFVNGILDAAAKLAAGKNVQ